MSYKLVRVSWLDTVEHPSGWYQPEDIDKLEFYRGDLFNNAIIYPIHNHHSNLTLLHQLTYYPNLMY